MITIKQEGDGWIYEGTEEELQQLLKNAEKLGADKDYLGKMKIILIDNQQVKK